MLTYVIILLIVGQKVSSADRVYLETATYKLDTGYTLDGLPDGKKSFKVTCRHNGNFSDAKVAPLLYCVICLYYTVLR